MIRALATRALTRALSAFTEWALSKNAPGSYESEDDRRWAYTIATDGSPYLTRVLLSRVLPIRKLFNVGIYLHHFHRPDIDQYLHNHPWKWAASFILTGSYTEERLEGVYPVVNWPGLGPQVLTETRHVSHFNFIRETDYHKVLELHGDVWTIFIAGPENQDWGFLVDGEHVPHAQYIDKTKTVKE